MKFFTKTLFFFISIIILQSSLTIFIITNIIKKINLEDAKKELTDESTIVYESYNSWKRNIWINLISLKKDSKLSTLLKDYDNYSSRKMLIAYLKENLLVTGIDSIFIKSNLYPQLSLITFNYNIFTMSDLKKLKNTKPHPYIQTELLGNALSMIGTSRVSIPPDINIDIFLIKRIDDDFCNRLTLNRNSRASFFLDNSFLIGSSMEDSLPSSIDLMNQDSAYEVFYGIEINKKSYNITIQKLGNLYNQGMEQSIFLMTFVSNLPYLKRLILINKTVLYVSILGASLTAVLSFFLSKHISKPIKNLLAAMYRIKNGIYATKIKIKPRGEIGELFKGFNEMALKLNLDKTQMENYIDEILMLKDYNEKIIHSIRAGIAIINKALIIEKANTSFLDYFKLIERDTIGKKIIDLNIDIIDDDVLNNVKSLIYHNREFYSKVKRANNKRIYEIKLYPLHITHESSETATGCVFIVDDVSKKVEFEEKIFQAEKLSSISMLSAGVAHEINNPLSSIMTNVQNLIEEEANGDKKVSLKYIEHETRRIARIVRELLKFSSSYNNNNTGSHVNEVIAQVINLINYAIKKEGKIFIETVFEKGIPQVVISEDELQQVIINLVNNSIQAIEERGKVVVRTASSKNDGSVNISVEDNGKGISEEIMPHIFDPFFTTKNNGEGTGLGLSVVYGIVKKYNGNIIIESKEGSGTKINLSLPVL